ncbi:DUF480 domain-containing protein [Saccharophagus sp. K07]|jgi:uncharacterized protein YceH (UPF0502 family)|uniref:YceH family protein n=1 Tax=Saccharophagus sp. K07 TaxID=2283636 RepID=UPI001651D011|nr:DUF480 domain-containing protein [Saccharophagus sp. K07]MBC6904742.1 DUF480 domain-containing protein [Saccharophagus sp. K07]
MKELSLYETRIIGSLIEKSLTTPEQYPLSLNALTNACNQKSNREPVLELAEATVQDTVDELVKAGLVTALTGFGSRVTKYQHRFCNTEFSEYKFSPQELGIICVLFLRGPQTPGELRTRTNRLCEFKDVQEVEVVLYRMMNRSEPLIAKLPLEPGKRESRYMHLFSGDVEQALKAIPHSTRAEAGGEGLAERVTTLEQQVADLQAEVASLRQLLDDLTS